MMHTPMQKFLGQYIEQVKKEERTFDDWIDEPWVRVNEGDPWITRREWWTDNEVEAARQAWKEAKK